ncbi:MAG: tetratricopeptide repeat protein, partial [Thermodesulfobacteriota bacterium]|nr:tetratricopeptide repeat protein [Thermodesulfobacteriota bacterium]
LVRPLMDLNEIYLSMRRHDKLEPNYIRIIALNEKRYGKNHPVVASNLNSLAWLYSKRLGRLQEAEALYKRALTIWESKSGTVSKGAMNSVKGLITIYKTQGRTLELVELEDSLKKRQQEVSSIQLNRDKIPKKRPDYNKNNSKDLARLADSYDSSLEDAPLWLRYTETGRKACKTGKRKDGEILLLAALHELEPLENADPSRLTRILDPLAMNYYRLGRYIKAKSYYELMMQAYRKAHGVRHASVGTSLNNLGYICLKLRQYGDAEKYFNESIALFKGNGRGDDPMLAHSLEGLATVYINQGRASEVPPLYRRAKSIWEKREGRDGKNFKRVQKKYLNQ